MTLLHTGDGDYQVAASEAAVRAREILERQIERGRGNAVKVLEQIDAQVPYDRVVPGEAARFIPVSEGVELLAGGEIRQQIHKHALGQFAGRVGLPLQYANRLARHDDETDEPWAVELLAHNLNELYGRGPGREKRYLMRSIDDEVRGWLSDRYRRLDSRPLAEAFVEAFSEFGAVALDGYALETKVGMKAVLPYVFEPVPNEVMAFFLYWGNSDFGDGKNVLRGGVDRLWCTNQQILNDVLSQVHLGKKLDDNFSFSQRTYELDTETSASAIKDMVRHMFSSEQVNKTLALVKSAHEEEVPGSKVSAYLAKNLSKSEAKTCGDAFRSNDIVNLPPGQTRWRLCNAISLLARDTEDRGRALELERVAGKVLA